MLTRAWLNRPDVVCPDNAVLKVVEVDGCAFDLDYCKGGICMEECPCGAIEMIHETI